MGLLAAALWAAPACGPAASSGDGEQPAPRAETTVRVDNHNWSDVAVYVVRTGTDTEVRLGTVTSMTQRRFKVPHSVLPDGGAVRLIADPIGSDSRYVTPPVQVNPGQHVNWRVENRLNLSSVSVR